MIAPTPAEAAVDWIARQHDPRFDDWEAFTLWLEADPAHGREYQRLLALDMAVAEDLARNRPDGRDAADAMPPPPRRRWRLALPVAAAAALAVVALPNMLTSTAEKIVTASGAREHLALGDGSRIILNDGARIRLDPSAPRAVTLDRGEVLFDVVHDPRQRFRVTFEGGHVENLGTRFVVATKGARTEVAVAEGAVAYRGEAGAAELHPGDRLQTTGALKRLDRVDAGAVGGWATPRLVYEVVPLRTVAADLTRELGVPVTVAPELAAMPVSASIQLDLDIDRSMAKIGSLLGLRAHRDGAGWRLEPVG